ncbi:MAG TPA: acyltransferase [Tepidisphaeraceae bacterium]|jgi:peptidoglycan/LPS O-acetylase OafA/YrhL|nr:acyltransferase [Tepidisphaeraceae bacterium]
MTCKSQHSDARSPANEGGRRSASLDCLRGIAILLVFGNHMNTMSSDQPALLRFFIDAWRRGGWIGVDLFFVLSGFLVAGLLFREYQKHLRIRPIHFLIRRGFKIYPGFWALILLTVFVRWRMHSLDPRRILPEMLFFQNYRGGLWIHTWSLAVEEHFYLAIVLILTVLTMGGGSNPFSRLPWIFLIVAIASLGMRIASACSSEYEFFHSLARSHLRMDSLFFGVLLGYWYWFEKARLRQFVVVRSGKMVALGLALLMLPFVVRRGTPIIYVLWPTVLYLASGLLLLPLAFIELPHSIAVRGLAAIGMNSYAIYLFHVPVSAWGTQSFIRIGIGSGTALSGLMYVTVSVLVGVMMTWLIEGPSLRLRDRFFPTRAGPPIGAQAPRQSLLPQEYLAAGAAV